MAINQLIETQQLTKVREQVYLLQKQLDQAYIAFQRSTLSSKRTSNSIIVKLKDLNPLIDGASPSFKNWRIQIKDKFFINHYIFNLEQAKIVYIFNYIANIAQKYLAPRYYRGPEPFTTHAKMILYLAEIFKNLFKAQDAYIEFCKLFIKESKSFLNFYTQFLYLLSIKKILIDDLQPNLYNKLILAL